MISLVKTVLSPGEKEKEGKIFLDILKISLSLFRYKFILNAKN